MQRTMRFALAVGLLCVALAATACASSGDDNEPAMKVWGYVVAEKNAVLELAESQAGAAKVTVDRVLSPDPAWIVVHADVNGEPGERVGLAHVEAGETRDVVVPLEGVTTEDVIVALHSDRGTVGEFDFDMMNKEMSPDRPFFVNENELARVVTLR